MWAASDDASFAILVRSYISLVFRLLFCRVHLGPFGPVDSVRQRGAYLAEDARRLGRRVAGALEHLAEEVVSINTLNTTVEVSEARFDASWVSKLTLEH